MSLFHSRKRMVVRAECGTAGMSYYERHKELIKERRKAYYQAHKQEENLRRKLYADQHKEERAEYERKWREAHKEQIRERQKKYSRDRTAERERLRLYRLRKKQQQLPKTDRILPWGWKVRTQ